MLEKPCSVPQNQTLGSVDLYRSPSKPLTIKAHSIPRPNPTDEIKKYKAEYAILTDDEIRGKMSDFNKSAPQYIAGDMILKQRDPIHKAISDLAVRVESIERSATKHEFRTWAFWIALLGVLLAAVAILLSAISR